MYFMHSRDVTDFLVFHALKYRVGRKNKGKKKIKESSVHRAQQSTSCRNPALMMKELVEVPLFLVFPHFLTP